MQGDNSRQTRRSFIRKSAFAIGTTAGGLAGFQALTTSAQQTQPPRLMPGPGDDYPWNLDVDGKACVSLFLLGSYQLADLFFLPISGLFSFMSSRILILKDAAHDDFLSALVREKTGLKQTVKDLSKALEDTEKVIGANATKGNFEKTYAEFGSRPPDEWDQDLGLKPIKNSLLDLEKLISVPILHTDAAKTAEFIKKYRAEIEFLGSSRSVRDLFVKPHSAVNRDQNGVDELALWRYARDCGLIWCTERFSQTPVRANFGNTYKCNPISHRCEYTGSSNDYCQEVDGVCNAMGT